MFSNAEQIELYHHFRLLVTYALAHTERERVRLLYREIRRLSEEGSYARDEHGMHTLLRQMGSAVIVCREIGLGVEMVPALLFCRPVQDGRLSLETVRKLMGDETHHVVELLIKTSELYARTKRINSENFQNLLLSIAEDIRVVLLIIADRLYLLRHAKRLHPDLYVKEIAIEVSTLYAPMAHKLGLYAIKGELEDLALKYTDRKIFDFIKQKLGETKRVRDEYIESFISPVRERLLRELAAIPFEIKGRTKSISSIRNKLRKQRFEDIYDLFAIRIILDVPPERERSICWQTYSVITDMFQPNPERLKDWISVPKSNGYESLHITVMGPQNHWVEVQIRTCRMDEVAELGVAAHWKYKGIRSQSGVDEFMNSVREVLDSLRYGGEEAEKSPLLHSSALMMPDKEIYVFTPQGAVINLPKGATVLDFAFAIHSRVGSQAISAKVNGKNVPIKFKLHNGDSVEVITSAQQSPKADWLNVVVSSKAKSKIRQILRAEEEAGIGVAKEMMARRIKNRRLNYDDGLFIRLSKKMGYKTLSDFYRAVADEKLDMGDFLNQYEAECRNEEEIREHLTDAGSKIQADTFVYNPVSDTTQKEKNGGRPSDVLILGDELTGVDYSLAQCCNPIHGDEVFGFISNRGIKIHRVDCPNAKDLFTRFANRVLEARWSGTEGTGYAVTLEIVGRDDLAVVTNITSILQKENQTKLRSYSIDSADSLFKGVFVIEVMSKGSLSQLMRKLNNVNGVKHIIRY